MVSFTATALPSSFTPTLNISPQQETKNSQVTAETNPQEQLPPLETLWNEFSKVKAGSPLLPVLHDYIDRYRAHPQIRERLIQLLLDDDFIALLETKRLQPSHQKRLSELLYSPLCITPRKLKREKFQDLEHALSFF